MSENILILGAGESGVGAAKLALTLGFTPFVSDSGAGKKSLLGELKSLGIRYEIEGHNPDNWVSSTTVIKSPGIPDTASILTPLRARGSEIISEIEFASRYSKGKVVAITGANGKTTTTALIHRMLTDAGVNAACVGNIGTSWARDIAERKTPAEVTVVEASSFQLDGITTFRPDIAVLLNITPDHLDRYGSDYDSYVDSKFRIVMNQTKDDYFIYDADDDKINEWISKKTIKSQLLPFSVKRELEKGAFIKNNELIITIDNNPFIMPIPKLGLQGQHNTKNAMAASTVSKLLSIRKETIREKS